MVAAVKISEALAGKKMLTGRRADMSEEELDGTFATLVETQDGGVFAGSFQGESAWERHTKGDELVQVIDGATRLTIMTKEGPQVLEMTAGMLTVVPQGCWHRFESATGVTVMTMTPQPTDHSTAEDPRKDG